MCILHLTKRLSLFLAPGAACNKLSTFTQFQFMVYNPLKKWANWGKSKTASNPSFLSASIFKEETEAEKSTHCHRIMCLIIILCKISTKINFMLKQHFHFLYIEKNFVLLKLPPCPLKMNMCILYMFNFKWSLDFCSVFQEISSSGFISIVI